VESNPGYVECPGCDAAYQVEEVVIDPGHMLAVSIIPAIFSSLLAAFITGVSPLPGEPPEKVVEKTQKIVGAAVASGFVGMVGYVLAARR